MKKHTHLIPGFPKMLHGGDYNPDQWMNYPGTVDRDFELTGKARCNTFSVGIFSWVTYEKQEGVFDFSWLDDLMDRMAKAGNKVILATPSGARPAWMAKKYPEVCRVDEKGIRDHYKCRHNHCWTSPVYRGKVRIINGLLAERYAKHPALAAWHISNEYNGQCYCEGCKQAFRNYLREKYGTLDALNAAYWTGFWSHTFTDWDEIEVDDVCLDGLMLDWWRFGSHILCDFMQAEIDAVRQFSDAPATTNMMGTYDGANYYQVAELCDFIADDRYPGWLKPEDHAGTACEAAMCHDMHRSMQKKPFLIMESTPSNLNWQPYYRLKRPGLHISEELLAVGHGADGIMYFQIRKTRGGVEKLHGAVIDHTGNGENRVYREVSELGRILENLQGVCGTDTPSQVCMIYDWEAKTALYTSAGPSLREIKKYDETFLMHYRAMWESNIPVDILDSTGDFSQYKVVIAPMLYCLRPGMARKLKEFTANGGLLISTYLSGYVNESNLVFQGGLPGDGLREVFGIWQEELDGLTPQDEQYIDMLPESGMTKSMVIRDYAERIHPEGAEVLGRYRQDFYAGEAAVTLNHYGKGAACYLAARGDQESLTEFYTVLLSRFGVTGIMKPVKDMHCTLREGDGERYLFIHNFGKMESVAETEFTGVSLIDGSRLDKTVKLASLASQVYKLDPQE